MVIFKRVYLDSKSQKLIFPRAFKTGWSGSYIGFWWEKIKLTINFTQGLIKQSQQNHRNIISCFNSMLLVQQLQVFYRFSSHRFIDFYFITRTEWGYLWLILLQSLSSSSSTVARGSCFRRKLFHFVRTVSVAKLHVRKAA